MCCTFTILSICAASTYRSDDEQTGVLPLEIQDFLSAFQATPIVGPIIGSPIKALVSTAMIIMGIARTIFYGLVAMVLLFQHSEMNQSALYGLKLIKVGIPHLSYSILNLCTFGIVGYALETDFFFESPLPRES